MSVSVKLTDTAARDLREIAAYISEQAADKAPAIRLIQALQKGCRILADFPESGALPKDRMLRSIGFRYLQHGNYLIFYKYVPAENTAWVMAFFNCREDYLRVMLRLL